MSRGIRIVRSGVGPLRGCFEGELIIEGWGCGARAVDDDGADFLVDVRTGGLREVGRRVRRVLWLRRRRGKVGREVDEDDEFSMC